MIKHRVPQYLKVKQSLSIQERWVHILKIHMHPNVYIKYADRHTHVYAHTYTDILIAIGSHMSSYTVREDSQS